MGKILAVFINRGGDPLQTLGWVPHPLIVTTRDNGNYIRALIYS